jgi:Fumarylacetoacetate (FAA) hydrolase family
MTDHPLTDSSDQRQRRKRCLSGAQRVDKRGNPFAVAECLRVNFPHSLMIFGPFLPDRQLNTSARRAAPWSHGARLSPGTIRTRRINAGHNPDDSSPVVIDELAGKPYAAGVRPTDALAVVIGKRVRYLDSPEEAPDHVAGYAISNDVSERHYQLEISGGGFPYLTPGDVIDLEIDGLGHQRQTIAQA